MVGVQEIAIQVVEYLLLMVCFVVLIMVLRGGD